MSDWSEDNFLDRLAPQLRLKIRSQDGACPDAETLCAVIEGEARQPEQDTVLAHLSQCADCSDLQSRLLNFEREIEPEPDMVWNQSRTRLDHWLEGFLRSEAARSHGPQRAKPFATISWPDRIRLFLTPRRIVWALSVAAVLALLVDGVLQLQYRRHHPPGANVATGPSIPPPASEAQPKPQGKTAGREGPTRAENTLPLRPENPPRPEPLEPKAPAGPELGNATAECPSCPTAGGTVRPPSPSPQVTTPVTAPLKLRLDPGNRLYMILVSIHIDPNGNFQFRGTLLLPVTQSGPIPLDKGTEVVGVGTISRGQTSMSVTELKVQGGRFRLKEGDGVMKAQTPGGAGVDFHRSQVLDMWPAGPSIYEEFVDPLERPVSRK